MSTPFGSPPATTGSIGGRPTSPAMLVSNNPAFRTPSLYEENGYIDSPANAYAPTLQVGADGVTPDSRRIGAAPIREYGGPVGGQVPDAYWQGPEGPGRDITIRHGAAEYVDPVPDHMHRDPFYALHKRAAPDPRRTPPPETRPTSDLSPAAYQFVRPFDQHAARQLTGVRFSMADHRRKYEDLEGGMLAQPTRRNTYRADPGPWDTGLTDYPTNVPVDWGGYQTAAIPNGSRTFRLDA